MRDIEAGLAVTPLGRMRAERLLVTRNMRGYDLVESRAEAIGLAVRHAEPGDLVLISGKGHEDYQITRSGHHFFDDRFEVRRQSRRIAW